MLTTLQENEEAKADLLRQFTDLQGTKVRLESDLVPLQEKIDLQKDEAKQAEERRQAIYVSLKFAMEACLNYHHSQDQLDVVVVKRENAVHAQKHYATELEKEQRKRDTLQTDADKVRDEFEVGIPFGCLNTCTTDRYLTRIGSPKQRRSVTKLKCCDHGRLFSVNTTLLLEA